MIVIRILIRPIRLPSPAACQKGSRHIKFFVCCGCDSDAEIVNIRAPISQNFNYLKKRVGLRRIVTALIVNMNQLAFPEEDHPGTDHFPPRKEKSGWYNPENRLPLLQASEWHSGQVSRMHHCHNQQTDCRSGPKRKADTHSDQPWCGNSEIKYSCGCPANPPSGGLQDLDPDKSPSVSNVVFYSRSTS